MPDAQKPDTHGWYRVHAIDGSGLDYSTTIFDPEMHVVVDGDASYAFDRPLPASVPEPKTTNKTNKEATK